MKLLFVIGLYIALLGFLFYCHFAKTLKPHRRVPPLGVILIFISAGWVMRAVSLGYEGGVPLLWGLIGLACAATTWRRDRLRVPVFWVLIGTEAIFTHFEGLTQWTFLIVISIVATAMEVRDSE